jgi:hypothetical protein
VKKESQVKYIHKLENIVYVKVIISPKSISENILWDFADKRTLHRLHKESFELAI